MTGDDATVCSGCGAEDRIPGQRYGKQCMNESNRKYRARLRRIIDAISGRRCAARGEEPVKERN
jgi:hypothetical protein